MPSPNDHNKESDLKLSVTPFPATTITSNKLAPLYPLSLGEASVTVFESLPLLVLVDLNLLLAETWQSPHPILPLSSR
jgi:hypothetical protein